MDEKQKTPGELRRETLFHQPKNGWDRLSPVSYTHLRAHET